MTTILYNILDCINLRPSVITGSINKTRGFFRPLRAPHTSDEIKSKEAFTVQFSFLFNRWTTDDTWHGASFQWHTSSDYVQIWSRVSLCNSCIIIYILLEFPIIVHFP